MRYDVIVGGCFLWGSCDEAACAARLMELFKLNSLQITNVGMARGVPKPAPASVPRGREARSHDGRIAVSHIRDVLLPSAWGDLPRGERWNGFARRTIMRPSERG